MTQLPLFPQNNPLTELDERVRTTEIGGELYASILDIMQYHGNKKNPRSAWKTTLSNLKKQGFGSSPEYGQLTDYQFAGQGQRHTPVVNLKGFLRIVQATEIKEWESIRVWLAKTGADVIKAHASRNREKNIDLINQSSLADSYEARRYQARHENIETLKNLHGKMATIIDNPNFAVLNNERYLGVFGATASELKEALRTQSVRDSLSLTQLRTLTFAEDTLKDVIATHKQLSHNEAVAIIRQVLPPIGNMLKELMNAQGLHHVTGQPLLTGGE